MNALRTVVVAIFHRNLTFGIGAQIGHQRSMLANVGQLYQQLVCEVERERHVVGSFVGGITEHHALVASALCQFVTLRHAAVDVGRLLVNGRKHAATLGLELVLALGVANAANGVARHALQVDVGLRRNLAAKHHLTRGNKCFARHMRLGIERQKFVQNSVRNLVSNLVGVAFRNRFR